MTCSVSPGLAFLRASVSVCPFVALDLLHRRIGARHSHNSVADVPDSPSDAQHPVHHHRPTHCVRVSDVSLCRLGFAIASGRPLVGGLRLPHDGAAMQLRDASDQPSHGASLLRTPLASTLRRGRLRHGRMTPPSKQPACHRRRIGRHPGMPARHGACDRAGMRYDAAACSAIFSRFSADVGHFQPFSAAIRRVGHSRFLGQASPRRCLWLVLARRPRLTPWTVLPARRPRSRPCAPRSVTWPASTPSGMPPSPPSCCRAKPAPARGWWRASSTTAARVLGGRSSRSTARPFPDTLLEAELFGVEAGRLHRCQTRQAGPV